MDTNTNSPEQSAPKQERKKKPGFFAKLGGPVKRWKKEAEYINSLPIEEVQKEADEARLEVGITTEENKQDIANRVAARKAMEQMRRTIEEEAANTAAIAERLDDDDASQEAQALGDEAGAEIDNIDSTLTPYKYPVAARKPNTPREAPTAETADQAEPKPDARIDSKPSKKKSSKEKPQKKKDVSPQAPEPPKPEAIPAPPTPKAEEPKPTKTPEVTTAPPVAEPPVATKKETEKTTPKQKTASKPSAGEPTQAKELMQGPDESDMAFQMRKAGLVATPEAGGTKVTATPEVPPAVQQPPEAVTEVPEGATEINTETFAIQLQEYNTLLTQLDTEIVQNPNGKLKKLARTIHTAYDGLAKQAQSKGVDLNAAKSIADSLSKDAAPAITSYLKKNSKHSGDHLEILGEMLALGEQLQQTAYAEVVAPVPEEPTSIEAEGTTLQPPSAEAPRPSAPPRPPEQEGNPHKKAPTPKPAEESSPPLEFEKISYPPEEEETSDLEARFVLAKRAVRELAETFDINNSLYTELANHLTHLHDTFDKRTTRVAETIQSQFDRYPALIGQAHEDISVAQENMKHANTSTSQTDRAKAMQHVIDATNTLGNINESLSVAIDNIIQPELNSHIRRTQEFQDGYGTDMSEQINALHKTNSTIRDVQSHIKDTSGRIRDISEIHLEMQAATNTEVFEEIDTPSEEEEENETNE